MARYYPILLDVQGRRCLVVGGGRVAERKVGSLVEAGAEVWVVAREMTVGLAEMAARGAIRVRIGEPTEGDFVGAILAIAATDDECTNRQVREWARAHSVLVNVVDVPESCDFIVPARIDRGPISIAVSTGGASPALAKHLREVLEKHVTEAHGQLAELMGALRQEVAAAVPAQSERAAAWHRVIGSGVLELLAAGDSIGAETLARRIVGLSGDPADREVLDVPGPKTPPEPTD